MYADMTAEELVEWEEAYAVDPWGPERAEMLHGIMCSLIDACHRTKGRPGPPKAYMPFLKSIEQTTKQMSVDDMKAIWQSAVAHWGGNK